jgi:hypothetical protein
LGLNRIFQALSKVELLLELEKHNLTATTYQSNETLLFSAVHLGHDPTCYKPMSCQL